MGWGRVVSWLGRYDDTVMLYIMSPFLYSLASLLIFHFYSPMCLLLLLLLHLLVVVVMRQMIRL